MKKFTLRNFLETHHGAIDKLLLSYDNMSSTVSEKLCKENYDKWFAAVNKEFDINMDLHHSSQKIDDFKEIKAYLELEVETWGLSQKGEVKYIYYTKQYTRPFMILEVHLK